MINVEDLKYSYDDGTKALKGINFHINNGDFVAFLGENGAGKSTLFLHLNGILKANSGKITIDGQKLKHKRKDLIKVRQKVGIVFQNPDDQIFAPTVEEDIAFGPLNLKLPIEEVQNRVDESLKRVGMEGYEKKAPHYLSGGQKKRVAIAGVLAMHPEILILDEPTAGLDPVGADKIIKLLKELNREGITILVSSHDVNLIPLYASRIFVMHNGSILKEGNPQEIFSNKEVLKKANLKLPIVAELFEKLKDDGISIEDYPLTIDSAFDSLIKLLK